MQLALWFTRNLFARRPTLRAGHFSLDNQQPGTRRLFHNRAAASYLGIFLNDVIVLEYSTWVVNHSVAHTDGIRGTATTCGSFEHDALNFAVCVKPHVVS